jgi:hypothetical protein
MVPPRQDIVKHVAVPLLQHDSDRHNALKTTYSLALDILAHFG